MSDAEVVDKFVEALADTRAPGLQVDRRPDHEKPGDIDAVAGTFAIEHTSIDTFSDQRTRNSYLERLLGDLEKTISTKQYMQVVFDYDAVDIGQDWPAIRAALKNWLETVGQQLTARSTRVRPPGVPFDIQVFTRPDWNRPLPARVWFGRFVPPNDKPISLRLKDLCDRKVAKLSKYKSASMTTILLLENDDIASMNELILQDAVLAAYPQGRPAGVDEFWYVSTAGQPQFLFYDLTQTWELPEDQRCPEPMWWPPQQ